jgi:hypothetical protein
MISRDPRGCKIAGVRRRKVPTDVQEYFRAIGKRFGARGGKQAAQNMTAAQRKARATKASQAAAAARTKKKQAK